MAYYMLSTSCMLFHATLLPMFRNFRRHVTFLGPVETHRSQRRRRTISSYDADASLSLHTQSCSPLHRAGTRFSRERIHAEIRESYACTEPARMTPTPCLLEMSITEVMSSACCLLPVLPEELERMPHTSFACHATLPFLSAQEYAERAGLEIAYFLSRASPRSRWRDAGLPCWSLYTTYMIRGWEMPSCSSSGLSLNGIHGRLASTHCWHT